MPTRPVRPRSRGPKATRVDPGRLLDAAQVVFAREGVQGASIRAIAREAGCDPSLIYYHFEHKGAMFSALLDRKFPAMLRALQQIADPEDPRHTAERLWAILQTYHDHLVHDAGFRATIRGEIVRGAEGVMDTLTQRIAPLLQTLTQLMRQGIQRGHVRADLPPVLGVFFFIRMEFEILDLIPVMAPQLAGTRGEDALPWAERAWFDLFWRGVAAQPQEALPFLANHRNPETLSPPRSFTKDNQP